MIYRSIARKKLPLLLGIHLYSFSDTLLLEGVPNRREIQSVTDALREMEK